MDEILGNIYCWFESLFGLHLANYLWGYDCGTQTFTLPNIFNKVGLWAFVISLGCVLLYYYFINHPRFNRWWSWLIVLIVSGLVNGYYAYHTTVSDLWSGNIGDCLMYMRDSNGDIIATLIYESDCVWFGVSNFIVASMLFSMFSFICKWRSRNCKHSPFI